MTERRYKVTIEYEIVTTSDIDKPAEKVAETVAAKVKGEIPAPGLGFGENRFWRADWDTLKIAVRKGSLTTAFTWLSSIRKFWSSRRD